MNKKEDPHVLSIANSDQCCYCGVCLGVCPGTGDKKNLYAETLEKDGWQLNVKDEKRCGPCTLCKDACPMDSFDYSELENSAFADEKKQKQDFLVGKYFECFVGYSTNRSFRLHAASGGVVTDMLCWLFEEKKIDGALVVLPGSNGPFDYSGQIVTSKDDLMKGAGSHYLPVPAMEALDQILYGPFRSVALVGIPCQLDGVRKIQRRMKKLEKRVFLQIGSFCGYTSSFRTIDYLKSRLDRPRQTRLKQILYRKGQWPGEIKLDYEDRPSEIMLGEIRDHVAMAGILPACLYCADHFNEFADISVGDAWLPEYLNRKDGGYSTIVARTSLGVTLLNEMMETGRLNLKTHDVADIIQSQRGPVDFKKRGLKARLDLKKFFTAQTPKINNVNLLPNSPLDYLAAVVLLIQIRLSKSDKFWLIINHLPTEFVRLLFKPMNILQKRYDLSKRAKIKFLKLFRFIK